MPMRINGAQGFSPGKVLSNLRGDLSSIVSLQNLRRISPSAAQSSILEKARHGIVNAFHFSDIGIYLHNMTSGELFNPLREGLIAASFTYGTPTKPQGDEKEVILNKILGGDLDPDTETMFEGDSWKCLYIRDRSSYGNYYRDIPFYNGINRSVLSEIMYFFPKNPTKRHDGLFELPIIQVSNWHNNKKIFKKMPDAAPKMLSDLGSFLAEIMEKLGDLRFKHPIIEFEKQAIQDQRKCLEHVGDSSILEIASVSAPAFETSRYFLNVVPHDGEIVFYLGGVRANPPMSANSALEIDGALEFALSLSPGRLNIPDLLSGFNRARKSSSQVPIFFGVIDPENLVLRYCSMQLPALHFSRYESRVSKLDITSTGGIGDIPSIEFGEKTVRLSPGDIILIPKGFERVVSPAPDVSPFGEDQVLNIFERNTDKSPQEIVAALMSATEEYRSQMPQSFDLAALAVKIPEKFSRTWNILISKRLCEVVERESLLSIVSKIKLLDADEQSGRTTVEYIMRSIDEGLESNSPPADILFKVVAAIADVKTRVDSLPTESRQEKLKLESVFKAEQELNKMLKTEQLRGLAHIHFAGPTAAKILESIDTLIRCVADNMKKSIGISDPIVLFEKHLRHDLGKIARELSSKEVTDLIQAQLSEITLKKYLGIIFNGLVEDFEKAGADSLALCNREFDDIVLSVENLLGRMVKSVIHRDILKNIRILGYGDRVIPSADLELVLSESIDNVMMYGGAGEKAYARCTIERINENMTNEETGESIPNAGQDLAVIEIYNEYSETGRALLPQREKGEHGRGTELTRALTSRDTYFVELDLGNGRKARKSVIIIYKDPSYRKADIDSIRDSFLQGLNLDSLI